MYLQVGAVEAARDLRVGGSTITRGTELTSAQLGSLTTLQSVLSNGSLVAFPEPYARRTKTGTPQPTYVNPSSYRALIAALEAAEAAPEPDPEPAPE